MYAVPRCLGLVQLEIGDGECRFCRSSTKTRHQQHSHIANQVVVIIIHWRVVVSSQSSYSTLLHDPLSIEYGMVSAINLPSSSTWRPSSMLELWFHHSISLKEDLCLSLFAKPIDTQRRAFFWFIVGSIPRWMADHDNSLPYRIRTLDIKSMLHPIWIWYVSYDFFDVL
jgi:hypothetical protein